MLFLNEGKFQICMCFFLSECKVGLFGENCAKFCGHCSGYKACDHVTGQCLSGCEPGYIGEDCLKSQYITA